MALAQGVVSFRCLTIEERAATSMTHRLDFDVANIPSGLTANTAYVFNTPAQGMPILKAGMIEKRSQLYLSTPLDDTGHTITTTTISVGDASSATKFFSAVEGNVNGTEVITSFPGTENTVYTADSQMSLTLGSPGAAKTLSTLTIGKFYVLFSIDNSADPAKTKAPPFTGGGYT